MGLLAPAASGVLLRSRLESLAHHVSSNPDIVSAENLTVLMGMVLSRACIGLVGPAHAEMIQPVDFVVKPLAHPRARFTTLMAHREAESREVVTALIEAVKAARTRSAAGPTGEPGELP
jgi:hypothetical protein